MRGNAALDFDVAVAVRGTAAEAALWKKNEEADGGEKPSQTF